MSQIIDTLGQPACFRGIRVFTSHWLEPDQPAMPIDFGSYGYLISLNLYNQLKIDKIAEVNNACNARH